MHDSDFNTGISAVLARLHACVDDLQGLALDGCTDEQVIEVWRSVETELRRFATVDHAIISQVHTRSLAFHYGCASSAVLMRNVLRVGIGEARSRVAGADAAMPRITITGSPEPAIHPLVAAAQTEGAISHQHARVITNTIDTLPLEVQAERGEWAEQVLVATARHADPEIVVKAAKHLTSTLHEDGRFDEAAHRERSRDFRFTLRSDGSCRGSFDLTAETTETLRTLLDVYAAPKAAVDGLKDSRTVGQRQHDGILDALHAGLRANQVPDAAGVTTTVILTTSAEHWQTDTGVTITGHGVVVPTAQAKTWMSGEARVIAVALDRMRRVEAYGTCHRIFTENQRLAMIARDLGCSFPGCDQPPQRCQAHHVTDWAESGPTEPDNGALLCRFHHREHQSMGWTGTVINGVPHYVPPKYLDPDQVPRRNTLHHPELTLRI